MRSPKHMEGYLMTVKNVQDVMLTTAAVNGMKGADVHEASVTNAPAQDVRQAPFADASVAETADAKAEQHEPLTEEQTTFIAEQLNEIMRNINVNLEFQYHKEVNFMSVRMLDKKTGEVLREIPPESVVEHMIKVHDWIGAFLDKTA